MSEVANGGSLEVTEVLPPRTHTLEAVQKALQLLPKMSDRKIISTAIFAGELEVQAYLIRGACAAELRNRFTNKLVGGRGKRDKKGVGVQARMTSVAHEVGVDLRTLLTDIRIYRTFFEAAPERIRELACECRLPREFFVTALAAPDPQAAIEMAAAKRSDPTYTRQQYRADVRAMKGRAKEDGAELKTETNYYLRVAISLEAQKALSELSRASGKESSFVVEEALLSLRQNLLDSENGKLTRNRLKPTSPTVKHQNKGEDAIQYSLEYSE